MPYFRAMRLLLAIPLLLVSLALSAQRYAFAQWGTDDGLPTSTINDIAEDPLGFLWLATDGAGLVRFDGARFTQPLHPDSLPSLFVTVLETDAKGNFWIGTERGPAFYDGSQLTRFSHLPDAPTSRINAILTISETEVWLATRNGLIVWDGQKFNPDPKPKEVLSMAHVKSDGHLSTVFTTPNGLGGDFNVAPEALARMGTITRILVVGEQTLYVGAKGVFTFQKDEIVQLSTLPDVRDAVALNNQLWLASATSGIEVISPTGKAQINSQSGLQFDRVRGLYKAKNGTLWVGSVSGLSKLSSSALTIYDPSQGLPDARVHSVYTATNGETWAGTATGVSRFSADFSSLTNFGSANGFPEGLVLAIAEDADGTMWFGTERGLASFNGKTFTQHQLADPFVFSLAAVANKLYIGTASGLYVRQGAAISQVVTNDEGFVQLLQHQNKLYGLSLMGQLFEVSNATIKPLKTFGNLPLDTLRVHEVAPLPQGGLAISVQRVGVYVCQNGQCRLLAKPQGLQSLNVKAIATSATNLWIGTERGLFSLPITAKNEASALQFYGPQTGFLAKECNERSLYANHRGDLLAGTNSGFYRINEAAFSRKTTNAIFITGVDLLFNPDVDWTAYSDTLMPWTNVPKRLKLGFDQNYLTFFFSSPEAGAENTYVRYKLEGQDKKWTAAGSRNEAVFTNIPANKYTFVVQQSSSPGFETFAEARIEVVIVPPYYRTWWFWTLIAGALTALVFFAVRYRINQLNARLTLEAALADSERKALRLQMNPHFVFNALDAISGFIFNNEPKEAVRYLTSFAKLMRLTLESSRESVVPLHNELQLLKNYIALEELRFNNSFTHTLTVADDVDTYETNIPPMLLQPFVENAILHGLRNREGGGGLLLLDFTCVEKRLQVTIEDNGVGRQRAAELNAKRGKTSLATSITAERIDLLSKSLGKPVTLTIKDLHDENGLPSGTRVVLSFPMLEDMDDDAA